MGVWVWKAHTMPSLGFGKHTQCHRFFEPCVAFSVQGFELLVLGFEFWVLILGFEFWFLGHGFWVLGFEF